MNSAASRRATAVALMVLALVGVPTANALGAGISVPALLVGEQGAPGCSSSVVDVGYDVEYDADLGGFGVVGVWLSGLDERCQGYDAIVSLKGSGGTRLAEMTVQIEATRMRVAVPAEQPVLAEQLTGVSLVLGGGSGR